MQMPKLTFIIPVYNVDKYLESCLDSVINQTLKDIEILCIDDASEDRSLKILNEYARKDSRVKIIRNDKNMGLSETRNIGVEAASGDYIWFVDSDDRILGRDAAAQLYRRMENDDLDVLMFEAKQEFESSVLKEKYLSVRLDRNFDYDRILSGRKIFSMQIRNGDFIPCVWMMMLRRDFLLENHLKFASVIHEDVLYSPCILAVAKRVKCIRVPYYTYYRREDSISTNGNYLVEIAAQLYLYKYLMELLYQFKEEEGFRNALQQYAGNCRNLICRYYSRWIWKKEKISFIEMENEALLKRIVREDMASAYGKWSMVNINNISKRHLFLYEYVPKDAEIVLYGLGRMGTDYIRQIEATAYCKILAVSDRSEGKMGMYAYPFLYLEEIGEAKAADYFVIAVDDEYTANEMYRVWTSMGIPPQKIVSIFMRHASFPMDERDYRAARKAIKQRKKESDKFYVAVQIRGGIGDCIISLAFCRRLSRYSAQIVMDIYVDVEGMQSIFGNEDYVRNVVESQDVFRQQYDLVIALRQRVHIMYAERERIEAFSGDLWMRIARTKELRGFENTEDEGGGQDLSILTRARMLGRNRYTMLGDDGIWELTEDMSRISLNGNFKAEFDSLGLERYITVNGSSGNQRTLAGKKQTKVWNREKFEVFCQRFKKDFPGIAVIQIGDKGAERIEAADRLIAGSNLEVVKYILKNTLLHIDGEGGMAHLATQLGTKCVVLFGPTPMEYYGYPQNINLCAGDCHGCMGLVADWYTKCPVYGEPKCMDAITPEMVVDAAKGFLSRAKGEHS